MRTVILLAGLLLTALSVAAPTASAHHLVDCTSPDPTVDRYVCNLVDDTGHHHGYALCLYNTPPRDWLTDCTWW